MDKNIDFYNQNADLFFNTTFNVDMSQQYLSFLKFLPPKASILDAGCGSGRDSKFFINSGYKLTAFDASEEMVKKASLLCGKNILKMTFNEVNFSEIFDGIWANASLLHLPKEQIKPTIEKLCKALNHKGIFYMSFKYGEFKVTKENGRSFCNMNEAGIKSIINSIPHMQILECTKRKDSRADKETIWLNVITRKDKSMNFVR